MRRIAKAVSIALLGVYLSTAVAVASWEFMFPTTIADNSSSTRTYYPVFLGFGAQTLVDSGKISANGTDTNMQIGSTNVKYMLATGNVTAVIPTLPANGVARLDLYTGYSPEQTAIAIISGNGGYVTVSDNASLELSDNFTILQAGYFDTTAGSNKYALQKSGAADLYVNGTSNLTFGGMYLSPNSVNVSVGWTNPSNAIDGNTGTLATRGAGVGWSEYLAFDLPATVNSDRVRIYTLSGSGNAAQVDLYYNGGWNNIYNGVSLPASWTTIMLNGIYAVSAVRGRVDLNGGGTGAWAEVQVGITVTAIVSSAVHTVNVTADSTNLSIAVDGSLADTIALNGASVPDNTNNLIFGQNSVMPYVDNITITVGGTQQLYLAPNVIISGTNIPDRSGNSHNGTITWGSSTNITASYGGMESSGSYEAESSNATEGYDFPTASMPSRWFAAGENVSALPFYDAFSSVSTQTGQPVQQIYSLGIIGLAFGVFLLVVSFTRSALMAYASMTIIFGFGASMTIIPGWIVFVLVIVGAGIMYLYRQVAY